MANRDTSFVDPAGLEAPGSGASDRARVVDFPDLQGTPSGWSSLWRLGPGMVTGSANLDPSAVITATVAGAAFSRSLLWPVILCVPFLLAVFSVTTRIGVEAGKGLLELVRDNYGRKIALAGAGTNSYAPTSHLAF